MKPSYKTTTTTLAVMALTLELTACGGGGGGGSSTSAVVTPTVVQVTQAQATDVVTMASGGNYVALLAAIPGETGLNTLFNAGTTGAGAGALACSTSGSVAYQYNKVSAVGSAKAGDTLSVTYSACNNGTSTQNGQFTFVVNTSTTNSAQATVKASNLSIVYSQGFGVVLNGSYNYGNVANSSTSLSESLAGSLTGTVSGFTSTASIKNATYALSNLNWNQTTTTTSAGYSYSKSIAFNMPYTGLDGGSYTLALTTNNAVGESLSTAGVIAITAPGQYTVTGYQGSTILFGNLSTTSTSVNVQDGSAGVTNLSFTLGGAYML